LRSTTWRPKLKVVALAADLSDEGDLSRVLDRVREQAGPVDVLVNNASAGVLNIGSAMPLSFLETENPA
jgi:NAD(P)-dependent dehydrogenase (short-subunit alcohol dehydrogenase family)